MAINENSRRAQFVNCTSFDELASLCITYGDTLTNYVDTINDKINSLPAEYSEAFIAALLKGYHKDNHSTESNLHSTFVSFIRNYANRIVNENVLLHESIRSKYIPIIVFSASKHDNINMDYLRQSAPSSFNDTYIEEIFIKHNFVEVMSGTYPSDTDDYATLMRDTAAVVDILTSDIAYEDYVFQFMENQYFYENDEYLKTRAEYIYLVAVKSKEKELNKESINAESIYYFMLYMIGSILTARDKLNVSTSTRRQVFESGIRLVYDSIDILLDNLPDLPNDIKANFIALIVRESFMYLSRSEDKVIMNSESIIKDYFTITYDAEKNLISYKVIPDSLAVILKEIDDENIANEAYDPKSSKIDQASRKIYKGYKAYKDAENKVDSQLSKLALRLKDVFTGGKSTRDKIIEGEKFSVMRIIKRILSTAAVFSFSKVGGVFFVITRHVLSKKYTIREKEKIVSEIELEIKMLDEKIEDARGDGNRQAKYNMMRTRAELQKMVENIRYGISADQKAFDAAKKVINKGR